MFNNLLGNALKYSEGPVEVSARPDHDGIMVQVRDHGIGIPADSFDRIFQIFQRLHARDQYEGTGIGLAVVRRIVERHGGRVWVESQQGVGSVFHVTLPLAETVGT